MPHYPDVSNEAIDAFMRAENLYTISARDRWNRQHRERAEQIMADLEAGRLSRALSREFRAVMLNLDSGAPLDRFQRELINALHELREGTMYNQTAPETQAVHERHRGYHNHGHDHGDGNVHIHPHEHLSDSLHEHSHEFSTFGHIMPGRVGEEGERVPGGGSISGSYGRQMGFMGPAARNRLRNAQLAEHEARRGGS